MEPSPSNIFNEEKKLIFGKLYLSNVNNRLRELSSPSIIDCKRWIWELVQNAKDSIAGKKDRNSIDIEINVENDIYIFKHNGAPFTKKTLTALLYKFTDKKRNTGESIGRFGTGFLTTHSLSKTVKISGDIILEQGSPKKGFSVTLFREGEDEELLQDLVQTENSFRYGILNDGWTKFEYKVKTKANEEAGKLGIQNLKDNIAKVMLFCPDINSVKLNDNGKKFSIIRREIIDTNFNECQKIVFQIEEDFNTTSKTFLCLRFKEYSKELSQRFEKDRNLRISCAIELDKNNNIISYENSTNLFCSLPLIGSESHELPFILDSPDFEPDAERQVLLLDGPIINEATGKISEQGINKLILENAIKMYKNLVEYICNKGIKNRHYLFKGINRVPDVRKYFDCDWYRDNFIKPIRKMLLDFPLISDGKKYLKIPDLYMPKINNYNTRDNQMKAYNFIYKICGNRLPSFEQALIFENILWNDKNNIKVLKIEDCCQIIESSKNINDLSYRIDDNIYIFLDDFLLFIKTFHPLYLSKYNIIPNINSEFIKFNEELASFKDVPNNMIELLLNLDNNWTNNHILLNMQKYTTGIFHDINISISKIRNIFKISTNIKDKLLLMSYIPYDKDKKFVEKRKMIYYFCKTVWGVWEKYISEEKNGNNFPEELWNGIDDSIIKQIIEIIETHGQISSKYDIIFMEKFLEFLEEYYPIELNSHVIIPNQNGKFCKLDSLFKDLEIPEIFKDCLKDDLKNDIRNELLDKNMNKFLNIKEKKIFDYHNDIRLFFCFSDCSESKKEEASIKLLSIIPKENEKEKIDIQRDLEDKQRNLFYLYNIFTKSNMKSYEISRNVSNWVIWNYSNDCIFEIIKSYIEKNDDITSLAKFIGKGKDETIQLLKEFLIFTKEGKIIMNQNEKLCHLEDLKNEGNIISDKIPNDLKYISKLLGNDIRNKLVHDSMERPCSTNLTIQDFCKDLDEQIVQKYNNDKNENQWDPNFKEAVQKLIENFFDITGEDDAKYLFPKIDLQKDAIILTVIYDKETRKNITQLGQTYGKQAIEKIIKNPKLTKLITENKISDKDYNKIISMLNNKNNNPKQKLRVEIRINNNNANEDRDKDEDMEDNQNNQQNQDNQDEQNNQNIQNIYLDDSRNIRLVYNSDLLDQSSQSNFIKNDIQNIINFADDLDFDNNTKKYTGNCGEAYIYELLLNSNKYKKVTWKMLTEEGRGELFEYRGKKYYVNNSDRTHYDIEVETIEGYHYFIEVKSTKRVIGYKIPIYLSTKQIETMRKVKFPDKYILAVVFNVIDSPKHFFMTLSENAGKSH